MRICQIQKNTETNMIRRRSGGLDGFHPVSTRLPLHRRPNNTYHGFFGLTLDSPMIRTALGT